MLSRPADEGAVAGLVNEKCDGKISRFVLNKLSDYKVCRVQMSVGSIKVWKMVGKGGWKDITTEVMPLRLCG